MVKTKPQPSLAPPMETQRMIDGLKRDYNLTLGESIIADLKEQALARQVYQRFVALDPHQLHLCVQAFRRDALRIQQRPLVKSRAAPEPTPAPSAPTQAQRVEERIALLECLHHIVTTNDTPSSECPVIKKRRCTALDSRPARKLREHSRVIGQPRPYLVDDLPFRTTLSPDREYEPGSVAVTDFVSSETDSRIRTDTIVTSQRSAKTPDKGAHSPSDQPGIQDFFPQRSKRCQLTVQEWTGSSTPASTVDTLPAEFLDEIVDASQDMADGSFKTASETEDNDAYGGSLKHRLHNIWPKFSVTSSQDSPPEIPFAVQWELCRIALHCDVDLRKCQVDLGFESDWKEQENLRKVLKDNALFAGKQFPSRNDDTAWRAALTTGQHHDKTVTYIVDFSYRSQPYEPLYSVKLRPLKLAPGHRLARRFGPDRWIDVYMPTPASSPAPGTKSFGQEERAQIARWLTRKAHRFLGRHWASVFISSETKVVKDSTKPEKATKQVFIDRVRLFATHGDSFRPWDSECPLPSAAAALCQIDRQSVSVPALLQWAIGINLSANRQQNAMKLFNRIPLSFSPTTPTVTLEQSQIEDVSDSIHMKSDLAGNLDTTDGMDMADGASTMSWGLGRKVATQLGLSDVPSAFQARFGGCKGMWMVDFSTKGSEQIWLKTYPSQRKFDCSYEDPLHRTFEVRDFVKPIKSAAVNFQFVAILDHNAVDKQAMRQRIAYHLQESLRSELVLEKAAIEHPEALRSWIRRSGSSSSARLFHGQVKYVGAAPASLEEEICAMVDSGFDQKSQYLLDLIKTQRDKKAKMLKEKLKISIPCSFYAYMLPDFSGSLEEDEISVTFSRPLSTGDGSAEILLENCDVLVARAPAHTPEDMQKVRAVSRPGLRNIRDVILFSTKGRRSLADKLSGGDFDGDVAWLCFDEIMVAQFQNRDIPPQPDMALQKERKTFTDVIKAVASKGRVNASSQKSRKTGLDRAVTDFLELAFTFSMRENLLGKITKYKERYTYHWSLGNPKVLKQSHLLSQLADQAKQGIIFGAAEWKSFRSANNLPDKVPTPRYEESENTRQHPLTDHILDWLRFEVADLRIEEFRAQFAFAVKNAKALYRDSALTRPLDSWSRKSASHATGLAARAFLKHLSADITAVANEWHLVYDAPDWAAQVEEIFAKWQAIRPAAEFEVLFEPSFVIGPNAQHEDVFTMIKAAKTFELYCSKMPSFAFRMAGRQLYRLKALESGSVDSAPLLVVPCIYAILKPDRKSIERRILLRQAGEQGSLDDESEHEID